MYSDLLGFLWPLVVLFGVTGYLNIGLGGSGVFLCLGVGSFGPPPFKFKERVDEFEWGAE